MEMSSCWEASNVSAKKTNHNILRVLKFHYRFRNIPALVPIQSHMIPVHMFEPLRPIIILSVYLSAMFFFSSGRLLRSLLQKLCLFSSLLYRAYYVPCASHCALCDYPKDI